MRTLHTELLLLEAFYIYGFLTKIAHDDFFYDISFFFTFEINIDHFYFVFFINASFFSISTLALAAFLSFSSAAFLFYSSSISGFKAS